MAIILPQPPKIIPKLTPMTPYEIYLLQVKGTYDAIRAVQESLTYYPPQLGGLTGQLQVIDTVMVLELTDFKIT